MSNVYTIASAGVYGRNEKAVVTKTIAAGSKGVALSAVCILYAAQKLEVVSAYIIPHGTGTKASAQAMAFELKNPTGAAGGGSTTLVTHTKTNEQFTAEAPESMGTVANGKMDAGERLTIEVAVGADVTYPEFEVQVNYVLRDTDDPTDVGP